MRPIRWRRGWQAALVLAATLSLASAVSAAPARLARVVMLMRHGVRPPTSADPVPPGWTRETWPEWPVDYGLLTPHGAAGVRLLAAADRAFYQAHGLLGTGCPAASAVTIVASAKPRAVSTAESWRDVVVPGCAVAVVHPLERDPDPLFHALDNKPAWFDGTRAYREALALVPHGGIAAVLQGYWGEFATLARVLECRAPACPIEIEPSQLDQRAHDRPALTGPADVASTAAQTFLLEYLEGMPMAQVGWGRVSRAQIEALLRFHPLKFTYSERPPYTAAAAAGQLARAIAAAMTDPVVHVALFAGHDTNIADLAGLLDLHWRVPGYPADDVPPGGALGFEVWSGKGGGPYVRAFFRAQTMDELRELRPFDRTHPLYREYLAIPGCGNRLEATACPLPALLALIAQRSKH